MDMMMDDERPAVIKHYEPTYIMKPTEDKKCVPVCGWDAVWRVLCAACATVACVAHHRARDAH